MHGDRRWRLDHHADRAEYSLQHTAQERNTPAAEPGSPFHPLLHRAIGERGCGIWGSIRAEDNAFSETGQIELAVVGALVLAGLGFFLSAIIVLGQNFAAVAQVKSDGNLVTRGPYAIVRNPIYLGYLLILIATPLAFGHVLTLLIAVPLYLIGAVPRILMEERVLRAHFGAAYDSYAARVKRFIPFVW